MEGFRCGGLIKEHMLEFYKSNRFKLESIIFYCDGVGESQFMPVLLSEVATIEGLVSHWKRDICHHLLLLFFKKGMIPVFFPGDHRNRDGGGNILLGSELYFLF